AFVAPQAVLVDCLIKPPIKRSELLIDDLDDRLMLWCNSAGITCWRFFSMVRRSVSWRRLTIRSLILQACGSVGTYATGFTAAANRAISRASMASVLASCPMAPA